MKLDPDGSWISEVGDVDNVSSLEGSVHRSTTTSGPYGSEV